MPASDSTTPSCSDSQFGAGQVSVRFSSIARHCRSRPSQNIARAARGTGTAAVGKVALLIKLVATDQARIRFYGTAAARTADASRAANVAAPQGSGLLLEFIAVTALLGAPLTPGIIAANMDTSPTGVIYYNIQPVGGAMSVDLTFLKLEN